MIVALTITDQDSVIRTGAVKSEGLPPPRMDRVASITIETGHTEEQKKTAVEISIRPDLLNTIDFSSEATKPPLIAKLVCLCQCACTGVPMWVCVLCVCMPNFEL